MICVAEKQCRLVDSLLFLLLVCINHEDTCFRSAPVPVSQFVKYIQKPLTELKYKQ